MRTPSVRNGSLPIALRNAVLAATIGAAGLGALQHVPRGAEPLLEQEARPSVAARFGRLPVRFEENTGQHDGRVRFAARHSAATVLATDHGLTVAMRSGPTVEMSVPGARSVAPIGRGELATRTHYLKGRDPGRWRTGVHSYASVVYPSVLDGIDLVVHGEHGQLEYDFVVAPGADPTAAAMDIQGTESLSLTADGDLAIHTDRGDVIQRRPKVYQHAPDGAVVDVPAAYRIVGPRRIGFEIASMYDPSRELVIDPVLAYSTYLGGNGFDSIRAIAVDATGACYVAGYTLSSDMPVTAGAFDQTGGGGEEGDVFVAKLNPAGDALVYATYIGGASVDQVEDISLGADGSLYAVGFTSSTDFPVTAPLQNTLGGTQDAFVVRLNPLGSGLVYATYLGGTDGDAAYGIAVDADGNAHVTGTTTSSNFPLVGGVQAALSGGGDGFVSKLNAAGSALVYSTYLGGSMVDHAGSIAVDGAGSVYVTGLTRSTDFPSASNTPGGEADAFIAKLNTAGNSILYARYLGGSDSEQGTGIAVDASGNAYVAGATLSTDFPTAPAGKAIQGTLGGTMDAFVTKVNGGGDAVYSTYLGGSLLDIPKRIAVDARGNAHVGGMTLSADFPVRNALQAQRSGNSDVFVARLNAAGTSLVSSTYLGSTGSGDENALALAVDALGDVYVGGSTPGTTFPLAKPLQDANTGSGEGVMAGFVTKIATPPLVIAPKNATAAPGSKVTFAGSAGNGPGYHFALKTNASGATVDANSGVYTAGPKPDVIDEVLVIDEAGDEASAFVVVAADAGPAATDSGTPGPGPGTTADAAAEPEPSAAADAGCGCRTTGVPSRATSPAAAGLALALLAWRRRSRR